ncbi:diguanylate cyclase (GGDEF) domain-containing protein [Fulvimarina manganoxydans]|uniref:Diguanylate cyclase (GGDEF) domain-containing protein n=2 Tax=Fulvimarina manganoxydans TaxID=937218 RepID=A0A1W2BFM9_9HYPH|nr:diguanylate cyclase (GGDEF) domain-containing protein [Fulvimarina manganoxydans]
MTASASPIQSLEQARFQALANICPALFLALCAVVISIGFVHAGLAPWWSWALFIPLFLLPKGVFWFTLLHRKRRDVPPPEVCRRTLRIVGIELVIGMSAIVAWQVWLSQWSNPEALLLLALCMGGQMVFLLFGLLHLRTASIIAACTCVAGMLLIAERSQGGIFALVVLLGGGVAGLCYVAFRHYRDFAKLVTSRLAVEAKSAEISVLSEENYRIANTDMLTDIGNRRRCFRDLEQALTKAREEGGSVSFGIIDLDGFKSVNDSHGHVIGDRLLHAMARRLESILANHGEVYRLGGDEFAFIVTSGLDRDGLQKVGDELIEAVNLPIHINEMRLLIGCSVGFATFPEKADSVMEIYDRADYALFNAKRTGRMKTMVFSDEHERDVREAALLERTMREADLEAEFFLTFQPIVDSNEDRTLLLECLARWQSPVLGLVSPGRFIVAAEQSGFISTLTPVLLKKALEAIKQWPEEVGISFNLSGHDIVAAEKVLALIGILMRSGVSPSRVEFEVTETALMMNIEEALANIHRLKEAGVRISLDDFGTGYSSLSQIQKLPLDKIKVDGSFIRDLADSEASRKIVSSVSALSRDLSLSCVVEGVETREQLDILQGIGCHLIQGYFYSKPMRETEVDAFLKGQSNLREGLKKLPLIAG